MSTITPNSELTLSPPAEGMRAALQEWKPRARALMSYLSTLSAIPYAGHTVTEAGMSIQMPDPLQDFPAVRTALQRAQHRSMQYTAGTQLLFRWVHSLGQFIEVFEHRSAQIVAVYNQIGERDAPRPEERDTVLQELESIIHELRGTAELLDEASRAYLAALSLLNEDQRSLGAEAGGMAAATSAFEQAVQRLLLRCSLEPTLRGLMPLVQKTGQLQIDQLRATLGALRHIVAECTRAQQAVARLAGQLHTTLSNFLAVKEAFATALDTTFEDQMQQSKFNAARLQWRFVGLEAVLLVIG